MDIVIVNLSSETIKASNYKIFDSKEHLLERKLADVSIQLDEYIFLEDKNVDVVFVTNDNFCFLYNIDSFDKDTVYFPSGIGLNFFCSPAIFSNFGKLYKIDFEKIISNAGNVVTSKDVNPTKFFLSKLCFVITRLGYKINVKDQ
jgi:hypothetical protein